MMSSHALAGSVKLRAYKCKVKINKFYCSSKLERWGVDGFQMSIKCSTSGGQTRNQEPEDRGSCTADRSS